MNRHWPTKTELLDLIHKVNAAHELIVTNGGKQVGKLIYGADKAVIQMALELVRGSRILKDWLTLRNNGEIARFGDYLHFTGMTGTLNTTNPEATIETGKVPLIVLKDDKEVIPALRTKSYGAVWQTFDGSYSSVTCYVNSIHVFEVGGEKYAMLQSTRPANGVIQTAFSYTSTGIEASEERLGPIVKIDLMGRCTKLATNDAWFKEPSLSDIVFFGSLPSLTLDNDKLPASDSVPVVLGSAMFYTGRDGCAYKVSLPSGTLTKYNKRTYAHPIGGYSFKDLVSGDNKVAPTIYGKAGSKLVGTLLGSGPNITVSNYAATTTHFYYKKTSTPIYGFFDPATGSPKSAQLPGGPPNRATMWQDSTTKEHLGFPVLNGGSVIPDETFKGHIGGSFSGGGHKETLWLKDPSVSGGFKSYSTYLHLQIPGALSKSYTIEDEQLVGVYDAGKVIETVGGKFVVPGGELVELYCAKISMGRNYLGPLSATQTFEALCLFNPDLTLHQVIKTNTYKNYGVGGAGMAPNPSAYTHIFTSDDKIFYAHGYDATEKPFNIASKIEAYNSSGASILTPVTYSDIVRFRGIQGDSSGKVYAITNRTAFKTDTDLHIGSSSAFSTLCQRFLSTGVLDPTWSLTNGLNVVNSGGNYYPQGWVARSYVPWALFVDGDFVYVGLIGGDLGYTGGPLIKLSRTDGTVV